VIQYLREIIYLIGSDRSKLPLMVVLFIISSILDVAGLGLIAPYITLILEPSAFNEYAYFIEAFKLPNDHKKLLTLLGLTLISIFLLKSFMGIYISWKAQVFGLQQMERLRIFLMQAYQSLSYTEYISRNSSEYVHSIQGLTGQFAGVVTGLLKNVSDGILGIAILSFLAWTNALVFTFLTSLLVLVIVGYDKFFRKRLKQYGVKINQANTSIVQGIHEGMEGFKEIRVLGNEEYFLQKVKNDSQQITKYNARQNLISTAPRYFFEFILTSFIVSLVIFFQKTNQDVKELLPILSVFGVAALRLLPIANLLSSSLVYLRFSRDSISRLYQDLKKIDKSDIKHSIKSKNNTSIQNNLNPVKQLEEPLFTLKLNNLGFRYPGARHDALKNITLEIYSGDSVGLIGTSGAGKTTLIDVFLGLLEPFRGDLLFNDKPLKDNCSSWLRQVAYLPQQVFLIDNTLRSNIALGVDDNVIDETKLHEALVKARIIEMCNQMPLGLDTIIGERGVRLSGGQRQRVALARAFYHGRNVLVMDEATSALDNETELEIVEEIKHLKGKITLIVIAHRLSTVQHCDRIFRLDTGQITESGTYDQVVNHPLTKP
jgi:ATP-binding cassette, subfamily B, bacterial PglK